MSYSSYVLNERISNIQAELANIVPDPTVNQKIASLQIPPSSNQLVVVDTIVVEDDNIAPTKVNTITSRSITLNETGGNNNSIIIDAGDAGNIDPSMYLNSADPTLHISLIPGDGISTSQDDVSVSYLGNNGFGGFNYFVGGNRQSIQLSSENMSISISDGYNSYTNLTNNILTIGNNNSPNAINLNNSATPYLNLASDNNVWTGNYAADQLTLTNTPNGSAQLISNGSLSLYNYAAGTQSILFNCYPTPSIVCNDGDYSTNFSLNTKRLQFTNGNSFINTIDISNDLDLGQPYINIVGSTDSIGSTNIIPTAIIFNSGTSSNNTSQVSTSGASFSINGSTSTINISNDLGIEDGKPFIKIVGTDVSPYTTIKMKTTDLTFTKDSDTANISYDNQTITTTSINVEIQPDNSVGDLILTSNNLQSVSSGGFSGQFLRIKLNGIYYKIQLYSD